MTRQILQLTDCHLFSDPARELRGIRTWPRFLATLADIRRRVPDPDLIVLTGDTAHDESLETYLSVRNAWGDWVDRIRVIPGNHDNRPALIQVFPNSSSEVPGRVTFHLMWDDWQLIGLDSQIPGELPGLLGSEQLAWLRARLDASPNCHTLLFLHHPPVLVGSSWLDKIGLQDAARLAECVREHGQVRLIACGHVHQELVSLIADTAVFTTPAVGPQFRPRTEQLEIEPTPPAYRLLELHADGTWSTQVLRCDS